MIDGIELTPKAVSLDGPPTFANVEEERLHRKQKLAGALRIFGRVGFGEGVAGHITVRDPEFPDHFWVNPFGMSFRHVRVSDLLLVNHSGEVVYGTRPVNRAAFVIHSAIHQARPDVISAAHSHSVHGKAFSSLGIPLDPITQDSCIFYEDHRVITEQGGAVVFDIEAGKELAHETRGVIRDPEVRQRIIGGTLAELPAHGFELLGSCDSCLPGPKGNLEHFVHASSSGGPSATAAPAPATPA